MTTEITTRTPMALTAENVNAVLHECLSGGNAKSIHVRGVEVAGYFDPERLESRRNDIINMLDELPDEFHIPGGGGWTFLNMCIDRNHRQWTDFHRDCDALYCLGKAIGVCEFTIAQRDLWRMFPGGMPYITIKTHRPTVDGKTMNCIIIDEPINKPDNGK
nr:MAG TPA: hypothetical protein [Caudoviricetes sp.]